MHSETLIIALQFLCGISAYGCCFYSVAVIIQAVFYLDVSFRTDEVSQALDGPHQVRTVLVQDLDYRIM